MFEAIYKITTLVESDGQGQRVYKTSEREKPLNDDGFVAFLTGVYQEDVYRTLRPGDTLIISIHRDNPVLELERVMRFGEDQRFEEEGRQERIADLMPVLMALSDQLRQEVTAGDVMTFTYTVQRP